MNSKDGAANETAGHAEETRLLRYPPMFSAFSVVCVLLAFAAFVFLYGASLTGLWMANATIVGAVVGGFLGCLLRRKRITLNPAGIKVGRRFARWEDIAEVYKGRLKPSRVIIIYMERHKYGERSRRLALLPYPAVLREVIPAVKRHCPNAPISARAERAAANPDAALSVPRWSAFAYVAAALAIISLPLLARHAGIWWVFWIPFLPFMLASSAVYAFGVPVTAEQKFLATVAYLLLFLLAAIRTHLYTAVPFYALDALAALLAVLCVSAAVVAGARLRLGHRQKLAIVAFAILVPSLFFAVGQRDMLAKRAVPGLSSSRQFASSYFWSGRGNLAVTSFVLDQHSELQNVIDVINTETLKLLKLPVHEGSLSVLGFDGASLVRHVYQEGKKGGHLYLYRLADSSEKILATAGRIRLLTGKCISPNGRYICWLELADGDSGKGVLKVYDINSENVDLLKVDWPKGKEIDWQGCGWQGDDAIVVLGYSPPEKDWREVSQALHLLKVNREQKSTEHTVISKPFFKWRVSPDFRHAFALDDEQENDPRVHYVNLMTGNVVPMGGKNLPVWQRDSRAAFRTRQSGTGRAWFCRFDPERLSERRMSQADLPDGAEVEALSPRGHFAILRLRDMGINPVVLFEVSTGRQRRLAVSVLSLFNFGWDNWEYNFPWEGVFSEDEKMFVIQSGGALSGEAKVHLVSVPNEWLAE